jgi:hypothetical protein
LSDTFPYYLYGNNRPTPLPHAAIAPPFDPSDQYGEVHTVLPPEQIIPINYNIDWWRGDFNGVMLPFAPPYVPGANTTPPNMVMSFFAPYYTSPYMQNSYWLDMLLTAHAQRNYSHFHLDKPTAYAAGMNDNQLADLVQYIQSWGFYVSMWLMGTTQGAHDWNSGAQQLIEPFLNTIVSRGAATCENFIPVLGEEMNSYTGAGDDGINGIIDNSCAITNPNGMPTYLHFTQNYPAWPNDGQNDVDWWNSFGSKLKGLLAQLQSTASAGLQGSKMWDMRTHVGDQHLVVGFEIMASEQLYSRCTEEYGNLRSWEIICGTRVPGTNYPAVSGFGNGCRYPWGGYI